MQVALPVVHRVNANLDIVFVPKIDQRRVPRRTTVRNDMVAKVAVGVRHQRRPGVQPLAFVNCENRWSNAPDVRCSRWPIVPQPGLRADFWKLLRISQRFQAGQAFVACHMLAPQQGRE